LMICSSVNLLLRMSVSRRNGLYPNSGAFKGSRSLPQRHKPPAPEVFVPALAAWPAAGAQVNLKLTFDLHHSVGADQLGDLLSNRTDEVFLYAQHCRSDVR
jgi:hypothetical protein